MGQLFPGSFNAYKPLAFYSAEISTTDAKALTPPAGCAGALVQATGGTLNWTDDGSTPTSSPGSGMVLTADLEPQWFGLPALQAMKFVAIADGAYLLVSYYA